MINVDRRRAGAHSGRYNEPSDNEVPSVLLTKNMEHETLLCTRAVAALTHQQHKLGLRQSTAH